MRTASGLFSCGSLDVWLFTDLLLIVQLRPFVNLHTGDECDSPSAVGTKNEGFAFGYLSLDLPSFTQRCKLNLQVVVAAVVWLRISVTAVMCAHDGCHRAWRGRCNIVGA